jgi:hypothetical protein
MAAEPLEFVNEIEAKATAFYGVPECVRRYIASTFEVAEWPDQVEFYELRGFFDGEDDDGNRWVIGGPDCHERRKEHLAKEDAERERRCAMDPQLDARRCAEENEHAAALARMNAGVAEDGGGNGGHRIATELHRRNRKLMRRARIGRARSAVRAMTSPIRPRARAHRSARSRARTASSGSRGDPGPSGDSDPGDGSTPPQSPGIEGEL